MRAVEGGVGESSQAHQGPGRSQPYFRGLASYQAPKAATIIERQKESRIITPTRIQTPLAYHRFQREPSSHPCTVYSYSVSMLAALLLIIICNGNCVGACRKPFNPSCAFLESKCRRWPRRRQRHHSSLPADEKRESAKGESEMEEEEEEEERERERERGSYGAASILPGPGRAMHALMGLLH
ncbi:hypothetical protein AOLI_G00162600 [Acnodon oligacanthus]